MQLDGVLSTSQAAKSFMGTGFDALVIFSDLFFSVILNQHRLTTKHNVFSQHYTTVGHYWHCYSSTKHSTEFILIVPVPNTKRSSQQTQQYSIIFIARLRLASTTTERRRSIHFIWQAAARCCHNNIINSSPLFFFLYTLLYISFLGWLVMMIEGFRILI